MFVAELDSDVIVIEPNTGRQMIDVVIKMSDDDVARIKSGYMCINCKEPLEEAFPVLCPLCGFEVRDRQILRAAVEFEGPNHVGPSKPLREILEERDAEAEKRAFAQKIAAGASPMTGLKH